MISSHNSAMFRFPCAALIAALSVFSIMTILVHYPRAFALLVLSKWTTLHYSLSASSIITSRKAMTLLFFANAIIYAGAVHFAPFISKHFMLDAFLSAFQILHMIMLPLSALHFTTNFVSAYGRQVLLALDTPNFATVIRCVILAKVCSFASAVSLTGLPLWSTSDGIAYYPIFLQGMGACLTVQLGCACFQVSTPSELPSAWSADVVGVVDNAAFTKMTKMAYAYLTMSLRDNPEMLREINAKNFREAMLALHTYASGDVQSEVLRGTLQMMGIFLSRGHTDESALASLKILGALHLKIRQLDSELAFTDRQMMVFLSLFSRNSQCDALILHEQLLRTMHLTTLPAVSNHLLNFFPSGTKVLDDEAIMNLSAQDNGRACATTQSQSYVASRAQSQSILGYAKPQTRASQNQNHTRASQNHTQSSSQPRSQNQRKPRQCFKCMREYVTKFCECDVQARCTKCDIRQGSHDTQMCAASTSISCVPEGMRTLSRRCPNLRFRTTVKILYFIARGPLQRRIHDSEFAT